MMQIDHELVTVLDGIVLMGVAMGLVAFMALVIVLMMLVMHVQMLMGDRLMAVQQRSIALTSPAGNCCQH